MKRWVNKVGKKIHPIEITTGYYTVSEHISVPIITTITVEEQIEWVNSGGTIEELIELTVRL